MSTNPNQLSAENRPFLGQSPFENPTEPLNVPGQVPLSPDQAIVDTPPSAEKHDIHDMSLDDLRQSFHDNPEADKGIGRVLDAVSHDIEARDDKTVRNYENEIIDVARSVAVRATEREILEGVDLSLGDQPYGLLGAMRQQLIKEASETTSEDEKNKRLLGESNIGNFMKRHSADYDDEQVQSAAQELYTVGKQVYGLLDQNFPLTDEQRAEYDEVRTKTLAATLDLNKSHADYIHTAKVIKEYISSHEDEDGAEEQNDLESLRAQVTDARTKFAALHAKRQKQIAFFDRLNPHSPGKTEAQSAKRLYDKAVQELIAAEVMEKVTTEGQFPDDASANLFIATQTVSEAMELDKETIEQYTKNNSRLGKVINYITGRDEKGKKIELRDKDTKKYNWKQIRRVVGVSVATALIGMTLGAATVATAGAGSVIAATATGAYSASRMYATLEARGRYNRTKKTPGLLDIDKVIKKLAKTDKKYQDVGATDYSEYNSETGELEPVSREEMMAKSAALLISNAAERETRIQKGHVAKRALGAVAFGAAVGVGAGAVGEWWKSAEFVTDQDITPPNEVPKPPEGLPGQPEVPPAQPDIPKGWWDVDDLPAGSDGIPESSGPGITAPEGLPGDTELPTTEFAPGTFNARNGDGFYDILKNMGVEPSQRDDVLRKASGELFKRGLAYRMEDGLPGIPRPGNLPQSTIEILIKAAGK